MLLGFFANWALAQTPTSFSLGTQIYANKCVTSANTESCSIPNAPVEQNISIRLEECQSDGSGGMACQGTWHTTWKVDDVTLVAIVSVLQDTNAAKVSNYLVSVSTGSGDDEANYRQVYVMPAGPMLTDAVTLFGAFTQSPTDPTLSYAPAFAVGPTLV